MDKKPRKSINATANRVKVSRHSMGRIYHEKLWYKFYVMWKDQFMSARDKDNRLILVKCLLSKLKHQKPEMIWFFLRWEKILIKTKRSTEQMADDYAEVLSTFQRSCTQSFQQLWIVPRVVSNGGFVMPPHLLPQGVRVNADDYKEGLSGFA